jgi:serine/threonine protein kinase
MLTGQKPFIADTFPHLFEQHLRAEPPRASRIIPQCPQELDDVIVQLLAKKPDQRPFNAREVQGKMLQIMEKYGLRDEDLHPRNEANAKDVSAGHVNDIGRRMLQKQIEARLGGNSRGDVSWGRILAIIAILVIVCVGLVLAQR